MLHRLVGAPYHARVDGEARRSCVGELVVERTQPVLVCPVHTWSFNLRTGQCTVDDALRIRTYATMVEAGRLLVDVSS